MNRPTRITIAIVLLLLLMLGAVYAWRGYSNRQRLQQLLATSITRTEGQRPSREDFAARRAELDSLPQAYRQEYFQTRQREWQARQYKEMEDYFKLSKEERIKELDKRIAAEEKRRKESEARQKEREAQRAQAGNNSSGGNRQSGSGNGQGGGGPGGPGGWGGNRGLAGMLDRTTPDFRAMTAAFRQEMAQRRAQLGLPPRQPRRRYL